MKMVKSLLLVVAAGLVAMAGAQAASLSKSGAEMNVYGTGYVYVLGARDAFKVSGYIQTKYYDGYRSNETIVAAASKGWFIEGSGGIATDPFHGDRVARGYDHLTKKRVGVQEYGTDKLAITNGETFS